MTMTDQTFDDLWDVNARARAREREKERGSGCCLHFFGSESKEGKRKALFEAGRRLVCQ